MLRVAARLGDILERETSSHVSFASFVDHYLRLPDFLTDVLEALTKEEINLFEAEQLARVTADRLGITNGQAKKTRTSFYARTYKPKHRAKGSADGSASCSVLHWLKQW